MKIEQLERFLVVADCLNFTTAAEKLYVGQSTISRQIAALEEELGVPLLIRGSRNVELTSAGKVLKKEAADILKEIDQMKEKVAAAGRGTSGQLKIATIPAHIPELSSLQEYCAKAYPNLRIFFNKSSYDEIYTQLDHGDYDLGITFSFWLQDNPAYETMDLCKEPFNVVCSRKHWAAAYEKSGVYMDQLRDEEFYFGRDAIYLVRHPYDFANPVVSNPSKENPFSSMTDMLMQLNIVNGVAVLPQVVADSIAFNLPHVPILDKDLEHHITMVWRKDNPSPSLARFLEVARKKINESGPHKKKQK